MFTLDRRQHGQTAGLAVGSDSSGSQEDLLLERMCGAFVFSVTETENSLPLMAYGKMQPICNLTWMLICGFLLFPCYCQIFRYSRLASGKRKQQKALVWDT